MRKVFIPCPYYDHANHVQIDTEKQKGMQPVACQGCGKFFLLTTEIVIKKETHKVEGQ